MVGTARFACPVWERARVQTGSPAPGSRGHQGGRAAAGTQDVPHPGREGGTDWCGTPAPGHPPGDAGRPRAPDALPGPGRRISHHTMSRSSTGPASTHRAGKTLGPGPRTALTLLLFLATSGVRPKAGGDRQMLLAWFAIQGQRKNRDRNFIKAEERGNRLPDKALVCTVQITSPGSASPEHRSPKESNSSSSSCQRPGLSWPCTILSPQLLHI